MELNYTSLEETEGDQRLLKQVQAHVCVWGMSKSGGRCSLIEVLVVF